MRQKRLTSANDVADRYVGHGQMFDHVAFPRDARANVGKHIKFAMELCEVQRRNGL